MGHNRLSATALDKTVGIRRRKGDEFSSHNRLSATALDKTKKDWRRKLEPLGSHNRLSATALDKTGAGQVGVTTARHGHNRLSATALDKTAGNIIYCLKIGYTGILTDYGEKYSIYQCICFCVFWRITYNYLIIRIDGGMAGECRWKNPSKPSPRRIIGAYRQFQAISLCPRG